MIKKRLIKLKIIIVIILATSLTTCSPVARFQLPYTGNPPLITYSRIIKTSDKMSMNVERVMKKFTELVPDAKIKNTDELNHYFQLIGYALYSYKGHTHKCSYLLNYQGESDQVILTINQVRIFHSGIEKYYFSKARRKRLNKSYEEIDRTIKDIMEELVKQLK